MTERLQKITPFLWFDHQAEEAANFYVGVFSKSQRAFQAMLQMKKLDIAAAKRAYEG